MGGRHRRIADEAMNSARNSSPLTDEVLDGLDCADIPA